ncbi:DNA replication complex GINS protein PSF2 [Mycotypha africana]|uniref:DNA replication complex GINS protein PSF2 n=1 Tax=Mycotypha africana TaxID=64632 RepID=UPI002300E7B0|nr:DNA replication complex GINS protein PSF2 [Mycotypha africana]KAI8968947.1 DNA replication complex GINS protein PSF2 [Mycotypha africana]
MALPPEHRLAFTPSEMEFIAGNEMIKIIPKEKMNKLQFIQGIFGPFQPPIEAEVPVWLAILMKKNNKCSIVCPEWLDVGKVKDQCHRSMKYLKQRHAEEEKEDEFSKVPFHYLELSQMLLETAPDDIPDAEQVRQALKDLRETRQVKAKLGLNILDDRWLHIPNMSLMEINEIKPFYSRAFEELRRIRLNSRGAGSGEEEEDSHLMSSTMY